MKSGKPISSVSTAPVAPQGSGAQLPAPPSSLPSAHQGQADLTGVLESITDAFFSMDREFRLTHVNREAERLLRKPRETMLGQCLWSLFPEAVGSRFHQEYERAIASGAKAHFEEFYPPLGQWYDVRAYPNAAGLSVFFTEITQRKQMEDAVRFLAHCGASPGEDFFEALALYLARSLQMEYVCIDRLEPGSLKARTLALYVDGKFEDNVSYALKDTPCAEAAERMICCVPEGVRVRYPKDEVLQTFGAESYVGTSLLGSDGRPIGLIALISRKPLLDKALATSVLRVVALRAAGELERRVTEDRLRNSEEFNRSITENSPESIIILDLQGRPVFMNAAGRTLMEMPGMPAYGGMLFRDPWSESDKAKVEEAMAGAVAGQTGTFSGMVSTIAGTPRWWSVTISPIRGKDGSPERLLVIARDVTAQHETQRLLEEQPKRLDSLIRASQEMLAARTVSELLDLAAAAAARITKARMAVCGHGFSDGQFKLGVSAQGLGAAHGSTGLVFKMDRGGVYQELLTTKTSFRYSDRELKAHPLWRGLPHGHARLQGLLGVRLVAADDRPCGVLMTSHKENGEFTEEDQALLIQLGLTASLALRHIQAKEQAERRATELDAVINSIADAVLIRDRDQTLVFANPAASQVFGVEAKPGEKTFQAQFHTEDGAVVPGARLPARRALAGEQLRGERFVYTSPQGRDFTLMISASPLRVGGEVQGTVSVWHDITEREKLLRRLANAHEELELAVQQRTAELQRAILELEREVQRRSATERALSESEERYRTLVESAPVGIGVATYSGKVLAANRSLCDMFGLSYKDIRGINVRTLYEKATDSRILRQRLRRSGSVSNWQTRLRKRDGSIFDGVLHVNAIKLGKRDVLLTIAEDVTAERIAQRHVDGISRVLGLFVTQASRRDYLKAVARLVSKWSGCSGVGIRIADGNGHLPFAAHVGFSRSFVEQENRVKLDDKECPCMRALSGSSSESKDLCGNGACAFVNASDFTELCGSARQQATFACVKAGYRSLGQAGIRHEGELLGTLHVAAKEAGRITPETVAFIESVAPLVGEALHRFQVEQALTESEEKFRALFEKHDAVMLLVRPESLMLVDANPAACGFFSRPREELLSSALPQLGFELPSSVKGLHNRRRSKAMEPVEVRLSSANGGAKTLAVHCSAITIRREPMLFLMVHDITEHKALQKRVLEISEEERQRVGQDLHDSLGGHLTGMALLGKALAQRLKDRKSPDTELATEVVEGLNQAVIQTRAIAHGLCPVEQNEFGLLSSLHEYAAELRRRTGVRCELHMAGGPPRLDAVVGSHVFRIAQEASSNALAHAKAKRIRISLCTTQREFALKIWNDGAELPERFQQARGLGLRTMKYRADLIGAQFDIGPAAGGGTVVSCVLPIEAAIQRGTNAGK